MILTPAEQVENKIPNFFEDGQICYKDKHGQYYLSDDDMVSLITLRKAKPTKDYIPVKRILVTWDEISFAPVWILPTDKFQNNGVPTIFTGQKQFCFIADGLLMMTKDDRVARIEL